MTLPRLLLQALYLAGRPWTAWVVAIGATIAHRAAGAGGFDAVILAVGPVLLWLGFSWLCRVLARVAGDLSRPVLPGNRPLPKPQLAVIVVPDRSTDACPEAAQMIEALPESLRRLVQRHEADASAPIRSG